jgi:formylglycine-generating enzyme required for sulfatase activity
VERTGTGSESVTKFTADVLGRADGSFIDGYEEEYSNFSQGLELMPKLAAKLSGVNETGSLPGFVRIEGGSFQMGSSTGESNEKPIHTVTVKSFSMGKYQVTQKEWTAVMGSNPSNFKGDNRPVENVTWYETVEYCNKRSLKEGLTPAYRGSGDTITCDWNANGYRLPSEAEWEFAAKGGAKEYLITEYSGSNNVEAVAWYTGNSGSSTHPVGTKAANSLGLYDMSGNVWEWCWDWYGPYDNSSQTNPAGASSGSVRVVRGGSWLNSAGLVRSAYRYSYAPSFRSSYIGFRLVRP